MMVGMTARPARRDHSRNDDQAKVSSHGIAARRLKRPA